MESLIQAMRHLFSLALEIKDDAVQNLLLTLNLFADCRIQIYTSFFRLIYGLNHFIFGFFQTFELFLNLRILDAQLFGAIQTMSNFLL